MTQLWVKYPLITLSSQSITVGIAKGHGMHYPMHIKYPLLLIKYIGPDGADAMSLANGMVGNGIASQYWLQPRVGF